MRHVTSALLLAALLIVGGVFVVGVTISSAGRASQPGQRTSITQAPALVPAGATTTLVRAGSGGVAPEASITVPVTAEGVPADSPLGAARIEVRYDPSVLDATACDADPEGIFGSGVCNPSFDDDGIDPDAVRFNVISVSGVSGDVLLSEITFEAVGQSGGTSVVDVVIDVFVDPEGTPISATDQDGQICLTPCDSDGDGYTDADEAFMGTDPLLACPIDSTPDNENPDAWPPDFNDDQVVNILDIVQFTPPYFNTSPPDPNYSTRKDLNGDEIINILDIVRLTPPLFGTSCAP